MSIYLQTMYDDVLRELSIGNSDKTSDAFIRAANRARNELSYQTDLATQLTTVTAVENTVTDMDEQMEYMLYAGVLYYMIRGGIRPSDPKVAEIVYRDSKDRWEEAKGDYWTSKVNANQATDSNNVIGLGYTGSSTN